ncbi:MAG: AsmA family protein [Methylococcales bacterium]|nr:AsmA family protein [Methylococcales bacterium]
MLKPVKIILSIIAIFVFLITIAVLTAYFLIDPNNYKSEIVAAVKEKTGKELNLIGELKLSVFPWLGVSAGQMTLSNSAGFQNQDFATLESSDIKLNLIPLLTQKIDVRRIVLKGLVLNLEKNALGVNSWDSLMPIKTLEQAAPAINNNEEQMAVNSLAVLAVGGMVIENAQINWRDQATAKQLFFKDINLNVDSFAFDKPVTLNLTGLITKPDSAYKAAVQMSSQFIVSEKLETFAFNNSELQATISSDNIADEPLLATLAVANMLLDKSTQTVKVSNLKLVADDVVISADLSGTYLDEHYAIQGPVILSSFNPREVMARLGIKIPELQDKQALTQSALHFNLSATDNTLDLQELNLSIDNSQINGFVRLLSFVEPAITIKLAADHFDVDHYLPSAKSHTTSKWISPVVAMALSSYALPSDLLRKLNIDGQLSLASLKLNGLTLNDYQLSLNTSNGLINAQQSAKSFYQGAYSGNLSVDLRNRKALLALEEKITHVNVESLLKDSKSKFQMTGLVDASLQLKGQGQSIDELKSSVTGDIHFLFKDAEIKGFNLQAMLDRVHVSSDAIDPAQTNHDLTRFSSLSGNSVLANGIIYTNDLVATTTTLHIKGKGGFDLNTEKLDYKLQAQLIKAAATATGVEQLYDTPISMVVTGNLSQPNYALDVSALLTEKNKAKITAFVDKNKEKIDSIVNKIDQKIGPGVGDLLKGLFGKH